MLMQRVIELDPPYPCPSEEGAEQFRTRVENLPAATFARVETYLLSFA
jgi:hypothetical protein